MEKLGSLHPVPRARAPRPTYRVVGDPRTGRPNRSTETSTNRPRTRALSTRGSLSVARRPAPRVAGAGGAGARVSSVVLMAGATRRVSAGRACGRSREACTRCAVEPLVEGPEPFEAPAWAPTGRSVRAGRGVPA